MLLYSWALPQGHLPTITVTSKQYYSIGNNNAEDTGTVNRCSPMPGSQLCLSNTSYQILKSDVLCLNSMFRVKKFTKILLHFMVFSVLIQASHKPEILIWILECLIMHWVKHFLKTITKGKHTLQKATSPTNQYMNHYN